MYATRTDIEILFGATNTAKWADADNLQDGASITARITRALTSATAFVDNRLRNTQYVIPFQTPYDQQIIDITAMLAGCFLYRMPRGAVEVPEGSYISDPMSATWKDAKQMLDDILANRLQLSAAHIVNTIEVVNIDDDCRYRHRY